MSTATASRGSHIGRILVIAKHAFTQLVRMKVFYFLAVFVLFFLADAETSGRPLVLAGLAMGFAAWTKNEGLVFALLAGLDRNQEQARGNR